jgi:endonuclease YncB( thermonuclease family)
LKNIKLNNKMILIIILVFLLIVVLQNYQNNLYIAPKKTIITLSNEKKTISGTISKIRDGDTIVLDTTPIRLNGLTCNELGTPLGDQAKLFLQEKISSRKATCTLNGSKSHDREIGRCKVNTVGDIGLLMITSGLCGRCPRYDPDEIYLPTQKSAGPFVGLMPNYCK